MKELGRTGIYMGQGNCLFPMGGYEGSFRIGHRDGEGTEISWDGDVYTGQRRDDLYTGEGTLIRSDGTVYEATWRASTAHGHGRLTLPNGGVYEGGYRDGNFRAKPEQLQKR